MLETITNKIFNPPSTQQGLETPNLKRQLSVAAVLAAFQKPRTQATTRALTHALLNTMPHAGEIDQTAFRILGLREEIEKRRSGTTENRKLALQKVKLGISALRSLSGKKRRS